MPLWSREERQLSSHRTISYSGEPDAAKVSRPGVRPAKAGVFGRRETYQGKSQSPVARRAGGRETNLLKPLDSLIFGMGASLQAVAQANAQVAPKVKSPGGRSYPSSLRVNTRGLPGDRHKNKK